MLRSLSFSRRRNRSNVPDPSTPRAEQPASATVTDAGSKHSEDCRPEELPSGPLQPLRARVIKRGSRLGWSKRWLETDDDMHILYVFNSELDFQPKTPTHTYLCTEIDSVKEVYNNAAAFCLEIRLKRPQNTLHLSCESERDRANLVSGLQVRSRLAAKGVAARLYELRMPRQGGFNDLKVTLINWEGHPLGVLIDTIAEDSPLAALGLGVGDTLLAVDDHAFHSHKHAVLLFNQAGEDMELVACPRPS